MSLRIGIRMNVGDGYASGSRGSDSVPRARLRFGFGPEVPSASGSAARAPALRTGSGTSQSSAAQGTLELGEEAQADPDLGF